MMSTSKKMCKGCKAVVVNPLSCLSCGVLSHPGCLGRTGHQWKTGMLLDCKEGTNARTPSSGPLITVVYQDGGPDPKGSTSTSTSDNEALLISMQRLMSTELAKFCDQLRTENREDLANCRSEILREVKWECSRLGSSIVTLSARMDAMEVRVNDLGAGTAVTPARDTDLIEAAVAEVHDRKSRENNLIIFKLEEAGTSGATDPGTSTVSVDRVKVAAILNIVSPNCYDNITVRRIGKRSPGKVRPVKVTLPSDLSARSIIRQKSTYKGMERIALDYTEQQRKHLRDLQERVRLAEDPQLTIRFRNGTPMKNRE